MMHVRRRRKGVARRRRGASAVEYVLILIAIVLPLGAAMPFFVKMVQAYAERVYGLLTLPFC